MTGVVFFVALVSLFIRYWYGLPSSVTLLSHQKGILYKRGLPVRQVDAGKHWVILGREKIYFLDARPIQVDVENRAVVLQDGTTLGYGFFAIAEIRDVGKALYSAANFADVPAFILLCCARTVLNSCDSAKVMLGRGSITDEVAAAAKPRLNSAGFDLQEFRFTQLGVISSAAQMGFSSLL